MRRLHDSKWKEWDPHAINGGKYATALLVTLFSVAKGFYPGLLLAWVISATVGVSSVAHTARRHHARAGTMYSFYWDVFRDWSLFEKASMHANHAATTSQRICKRARACVLQGLSLTGNKLRSRRLIQPVGAACTHCQTEHTHAVRERSAL